MNNYICVGRITKDIELRYTPSNKAVVEIPLAVNNGKDDTYVFLIRLCGLQRGGLLGIHLSVSAPGVGAIARK